MKRGIVIGSRGSRLAMVQAATVGALIKMQTPETEVSIRRIVTGGDRQRNVPLEQLGGIGIFVKELETALLDGRIDLAVHSLKDMPADIPAGLRLAAVLEREDPHDVLVTRGARLAELPPGARIGTGSLRRAVQLAAARPDVEACGIRGNVDTRLRKVTRGEFDGVILAAAALKRLGMADRASEYLDAGCFLPAVGQGALAIEIRADDSETAGAVEPLNHLPTWQAVSAERAFLRTLGGGCRAPIAALGSVSGSRLKLEGMVGDVSLKQALYHTEEGSTAAPEELGERLAQRLLGMGAAAFIAAAEETR